MNQKFKDGMEIEVWDDDGERYPEGKLIKGKVWTVTTNSVTIKWADLNEAITYDIKDRELEQVRIASTYNFFWAFIHNVIAHPLLILRTKWTEQFHDWTAEKI